MTFKKKFFKAMIASYLWCVNLFRRTHKPKEHMDKFSLPIDDFNILINKYDYRPDPLGGLIDIVGRPEKFFDENKKHNRDCDNFANVICVNAIMNGYEADEYVVTDPSNMKTLFQHMHVIAVLQKDGEYILANYRLYKGFKSAEDALGYMRYFSSYKDDMLVVHSRKVKLK